MKNTIVFFITFIVALTASKAQTTAQQMTRQDCNGNPVNFFTDLDSGKAIILHFFMPNCGSCPPPAQKIQAMANNINAVHPGMVKGYAMPFNNSTTCTYASNWVVSNGLGALYAPMDSGANAVAYYGGFGMPTVVVLGGRDHRILFSSLSFSTSDTTAMRDSILSLLAAPNGIDNLPVAVSSFSVFPNPASDRVSINLNLKETTDVLVDLCDIAGKQIATILSDKQTGAIIKQYNTSALPSGNYFVRLQVNGKTVSQKLNIAH